MTETESNHLSSDSGLLIQNNKPASEFKMMALFLQLTRFRQRTTHYLGEQATFSYVFYDYNPIVSQITLTAPVGGHPAYIFQHASRKISGLEIQGDFGAAKLTGVVWNNPTTRIFDFVLEMKTADDAVFALVGRGVKLLAYSCFIDVGRAVIKADTARISSFTQTTLLGEYILCGKIPYQKMTREDAMFTDSERLMPQPVHYVEPCRECIMNYVGKGCARCRDGTYEDATQCLDNPALCGCICTYNNFEMNAYLDECVGQPMLVNEPILDADNKTRYFFDCMTNKALEIVYSSLTPSSFRYQVFRDELCGLSNLQITLNLTIYSADIASQAIAGLAYEMTKNVSMIRLSSQIQNMNKKLDYFALLYRWPQYNAVLSLEGIYLTGVAHDSAGNVNNTTEFHINGMFHETRNVKIILANVSVQKLVIKSFYNGTYCSFGVGFAYNTTFSVDQLFIGHNNTTLANPIASIDYNELGIVNASCEDKMSSEMQVLVRLHRTLPMTLKVDFASQLDIDLAPRGAGFIGKSYLSSITMNRSAVALYFYDSRASSIGFGIMVYDFIDSTANINMSLFYGNNQVFGPSGVLAMVNGTLNSIYMHAAVNLTSPRDVSGVVGYMQQAIATFSVFLTCEFTSNITGGLIGQMDNGIVTIKAAFGRVKLGKERSAREIGLWLGGYVDDYTCDFPPCKLESPANSYININNTNDGLCGPYLESSEPIGDYKNVYFLPCESNVYAKISYEGSYYRINLSVFYPNEACRLINIKISGEMKVTADYMINISGMVIDNNEDISNITNEIVITMLGYGAQRASLVAIRGTQKKDIVVENVLIAGRFNQQEGTTRLEYLTAFFNEQRYDVTMTNASFLGVQLTSPYADKAAFVVGRCGSAFNLTNVLINDYRKNNVFPDFSSPSEAVTFPCPTLMGEEHYIASRFKNLLSVVSRPCFIKDTYGLSLNSGALFGYMTYDVIIKNVAANISLYQQRVNFSYNGLLFGNVYNGKLYISYAYVTGAGKVEYAGILGYGQTHFNLSIVVEFTFERRFSALVMFASDSNGYNMSVNALVNLTMMADNCAGIYYSNSRSTKNNSVAGIIRKSGNEQFNYELARRLDAPDESTSNSSFSNTEQCPAALVS